MVKAAKNKSTAKLKKINSKLTSSKKSLESKVEDLTAQVKKLNKKSSKKAKKLLKKLDESYQVKANYLKAEFDARLVELSKNQGTVTEPKAKVVTEKTSSTTVRSAKPVKVATPSKSAPSAKPQTPVVAKKPTIASVKGIGPITLKKLAEAGITSLEDIANTPAAKVAALKQFEKVAGYNTWQTQAKALLADK